MVRIAELPPKILVLVKTSIRDINIIIKIKKFCHLLLIKLATPLVVPMTLGTLIVNTLRQYDTLTTTFGRTVE